MESDWYKEANDMNETYNYKKKSFYTPLDIIEKVSGNEVMSNLLLTWAGCYTKAYGHIVNGRVLEDYVIVYCVDGLGWLELLNNRWIIKKGDIFVCPPNVIHYYGADDKVPWTKYWIHFRGKVAGAYMEMLGLTQDSPILNVGENPKIIAWLHDIFNILKSGYTQSNLLFATSYLSNILSCLSSHKMSGQLNKAIDMNVETVITHMLDNIDGRLTLSQMSDFANLSKYHFIRLFREKTGYTPIDYYIRLKIQKACELLEESNVTISSISTAIGFSSPYYFSLAFKKIIGRSPQRYREML